MIKICDATFVMATCKFPTDLLSENLLTSSCLPITCRWESFDGAIIWKHLRNIGESKPSIMLLFKRYFDLMFIFSILEENFKVHIV